LADADNPAPGPGHRSWSTIGAHSATDQLRFLKENVGSGESGWRSTQHPL